MGSPFTLEMIAANLSASWRKETLHGRTYWVGPATMIVPGVLNGSKGPLLYPGDEIQRSTPAWNGMPITDGHPKDEFGNHTSARRPSVLEKYQLGMVFEANYTDKLNAEAWLDEELTRRKRPEILNAIKANRPVELSTGLRTDDDNVPGTWVNAVKSESRDYRAVARNYVPDHLAVLVGQRGACSVADGCGLGVNSEPDDHESENLLMRAWSTLVNAFKPNQPRSQVTGKIKRMTAGQGKGEVHEAAQQGVYGSVDGHVKPGAGAEEGEEVEPTVNYIREKDGKFCVYSESGEKLGEHDTKAEAEAQLRAIEANKHKANTEGSGSLSANTDPEDDMKTRSEKVAFLVANCDCWNGKEQLLGNEKLLDDAAIDKLVANAQQIQAGKTILATLKEVGSVVGAPATLTVNEMPAFIKEKMKKGGDEEEEEEEEEGKTAKNSKKKEEGTVNVGKLTQNQLDELSKSMFGLGRQAVLAGLRFATNHEARAREELLSRLVANAATEADRKTAREIYADLPLEKLEALAQTIPAVRNAGGDRSAIFVGAWGGAETANASASSADDLEVLDEPVYNAEDRWSKKRKAKAQRTEELLDA